MLKFIKVYEPQKARKREKKDGSLILRDKKMIITIHNAPGMTAKMIGVIDGGIGVKLEPCPKNKGTYLCYSRKCDEADLPAELKWSKYKYTIPATKVSDTEYVFMFKDAKAKAEIE